VVLLRRADGADLTVLLLATTTGYQIRSFGEAARRLGIELAFASDRCDQLEDPWWDHAIPVRFHDEDRSLAAIVAAFPDAPPQGILAVGDRPTVLAARAAAAFGLPGHPAEAAANSRNKLASRRAFKAAGLPTPVFQPVPVDRDAYELSLHVEYPAVIKPLALSGSRGVMRVNTGDEFIAAFDRLRRLLDAADVKGEREAAHQMAMIESFIPGAEFAVEGLLEQGAFRPLAIFDKPDPLDGPFFEETIYVTPSRASRETEERILTAVGKACQALGLRHGPIHAECRVAAAGPQGPPLPADTGETDVFVLEVAARPIGGLCSRALRFGRDASLEEVLLRHAVGEDVSGYERDAQASGVMMIPIPRRGVYRGAEGVDAARAVAGIDDVVITARPDTTLVPLPEGKSYLGFIFARGEDAGAVERALRDAHARLEFVIDRELAVVPEPRA
jgi:biotin carboxylase